MKIRSGLVIALSFCGAVYAAAPLVMEAPISGFGTPASIAISSTTMTMVPSSQTVGRVGVYISLPSNTPTGLPVAGFFGNCTSNSVANTVLPIEIASSSSTTTNRYFQMREDVCLWLRSLDTTSASRTIHYQEIKK